MSHGLFIPPYPAAMPDELDSAPVSFDPLAERLQSMGITQAAFARSINVSDAVVTNWKRRGIPRAHLYTVAKAVGLSVERYMQEANAPPPPKAAAGKRVKTSGTVSEPLPADKYIFVPKYDALAGLGRGRFNESHVEVSSSHAYRADMIAARGWRADALVVVKAVGDSMSPAINDGDVVLINTDETAIISGLLYAIEDPDHGVRIKRLRKLLDGRIRVESDNPDKRLHPDDFLTPDSRARIIGRAVDRSGAL